MKPSFYLPLLGAALGAALITGCPPPVEQPDVPTPGDARDDGPRPTCADGDDDTIPDSLEGSGDADNDGLPNVRDTDSDGDGRPDALEANVGRPFDGCRANAAVVDSDRDGTPDFLDTDSDNNGINDAQDFIGTGEMPMGGWQTTPSDWDRDETPDYADPDDDNDNIPDAVEIAPGTAAAPTDTDMDATPDYRDADSDGDTIRDVDETATDPDGDMLPSFRDDDSDGDGLADREEAGDTDLVTPPIECARELDVSNPMRMMSDGARDFRDVDSDNDGLADGEEAMAGTDRCNSDTDGDGQLDLVEAAYCTRRMRTGCATDPGVTIPPTDYFVVLPDGASATRELEFGTQIRVADVFFLSDTTGSMNTVLASVRNSIATPMTGLVDRIRTTIMNAWFGVGHYEDFPTGSHAPSTDRVFHALCPGLPDSSTAPGCVRARYGGIQVTDNAANVQTAAQAIPAGSGSDGLSTSVEALYQLMTGEGLYDRSSPTPCRDGSGAGNCWVPPTTCAEGHFGAACFREAAMPVVVHYSDTQSHWGSRNISPASTTFNRETTGISPPPHNNDQMLMAFRRRGGRMISLNAQTSTPCEGRVLTAHASTSPCFDFRVWAEGTGSLDLNGAGYIFDIRVGDTTSFVEATVRGIEQLATRTPIDVSTSLENDAANPHMVDARRFITRRIPSCQVPPTNTMCWTAPMDVPHAQAVARTDQSTFYRVLPGTRVRFTIQFANMGVYRGAPDRSTLFRALIHVVADGVSRLDTREVYILVPARPADPG